MKHIIKWISLSILGLILTTYLVLAGFLWWSEEFLNETTKDVKAVYASSTEVHELTLIDDGLASLLKRLELIESAKKSIELEFFIYELDLASQIITQKLIEAAQRGVSVKILVDFSAPVFKLKPAYAGVLKKKNIEVKYYNTAATFRFVSMQHRSHRKFLIIDDEVVITGGRNIGDDYFNLSTHYNFLDSDLMIRGPIVKEIRKSYFDYWNSSLSSLPEIEEESELAEEVKKFTEANSQVMQALSEIKAQKAELDKSYFQSTCKDISFVTDHPGIMISNRQVYRRLAEFLQAAEKEVIGESPYFVLRNEGLELVKQLSRKKINQTYLTNSLNSTDAYYTVSAMTSTLSDLQGHGVNIQIYEGRKPKEYFQLSTQVSERWGVHSKRAVVDQKHVLIGTYNVDPRSANLNSEVIIICRNNPELAQQMIKSIENRINLSRPLFTEDTHAITSLTKDASFGQKAMFVLAMPLANMFDFLL